jgi:2-succinyl-5-enolpyruvyl-6-hydroxy-3-cyclohexene-1-carboxylate synthase
VACITRSVADAPFCDLTVFEQVTGPDPGGIVLLHLANSTPARYVQLFDRGAVDMRWFSNRGTSGIDGCTSTAVGAAFVRRSNSPP